MGDLEVDIKQQLMESADNYQKKAQTYRNNGELEGSLINYLLSTENLRHYIDMNKDDKKVIDFIEKYIKPAVIEVCDHLGPFWYNGKPEEYHTRALAYELNERNLNFDIEVDGGITIDTAPLVKEAGADVLVAGSAIFAGGSVENPSVYGENIRAIRNSVGG